MDKVLNSACAWIWFLIVFTGHAAGAKSRAFVLCTYSEVPNRRADRNKQADWEFLKKYKPAGWNKWAGGALFLNSNKRGNDH